MHGLRPADPKRKVELRMDANPIDHSGSLAKPISLGEQIAAIRLMKSADFHRSFRSMREAEIDRTILALDAAITTIKTLAGE